MSARSFPAVHGDSRRLLATLLSALLLVSGLAVTLVVGATVASAQTVTIESDKYINVTPGKTVYVGYSFEYVEGASTVVKDTTAVLQVTCKDSKIIPTQSTIVVPIPDAAYPAPAPNDGKFVPSGKKNDLSTFQASTVVGDYCKGTPMVLGKKGATQLTSDVYSSNSTKKIYFQWHFGADLNSGGDDESDNPEVEGSWKKDSVTPEPLEAVGADVAVTKSEAADPVRPGENITYTISAVNNSTVLDATNVVVTDTLDATTTFVSAPGCTRSGATLTCPVGTLAKKGSKTFTVTVATSANATTDAFTGSSSQPGGYATTCPTSDVCNKVSINAATKDTDTTNNAYYQPTNLTKPGMALVKTVTDASGNGVAELGEVLTYTFSVSNTGSLPLSNVKLSDAKLGLSSADCVASLGVGATTTCPLLAAERKRYTVTSSDIALGSVINTASATGTPSVGSAITSSDSRTIPAPAAPALSLVKTVADSADAGSIANLGETLTYGFTVKNTGNVPLSNVTVSDPMVQLGNASCASTLAVGASATCFTGRTYSVTSADIGRGVVTNTATASGTGSSGGSATTTGTATIPTEAARPAVLLTKSVADSPADSDSIGSLGETLTYGFVVTNTGNVPLTSVTITDAAVGLAQASCVATLEAGASATCPSAPTRIVAAADIERGSITNTALARGTTSGGTAVTDDDSVTIATPAAPGFALSKTVADGPDAGNVANLDEELTYTFRVTNTGNVRLTDVTVTDARVNLSAAPCVATLDPGVTATCSTQKYTVTEDDVESGSVVNNASANARYGATTLTSADSATLTTETAAPLLTIVKTVADSATDGDSIGSLGETLTYTFRVTNKGNVALKNVTLSDPLLGLDGFVCAAKLSVKASTTCSPPSSRTYTVKASDIEKGSVVNTATTAGSGGGKRVTASDTATIATPAVPAISLSKSVRDANNDSVGALGETLTYAFKVTNTGNVPLSNVTLTDSRLGLTGASCVSTLAVGASADCTGRSAHLRRHLGRHRQGFHRQHRERERERRQRPGHRLHPG